MRLIKEGKLSVDSLLNFIGGVLFDRMSSEDLSTVLDVLVKAGNPETLHIAVDFGGHCIQRGRQVDPVERAAMWRVLEASGPVDDRAEYWWIQAVETLAPSEPERACALALAALAGDDSEKRDHAWNILSSVARTQPDLVMDSAGRLLLDEERGWRLRIGIRGGLFEALPFESVKRWLGETGIRGARAIASHLEQPFLGGEGTPQVPSLTAYVLSKWGDDDIVFGRFAASTHHLQMYSGDIAAQHELEAACSSRRMRSPE